MSNGRVLVMCASRGRPDRLNKMIRSVRDTSSLADIAVYLDDDQEADYKLPGGINKFVGPRVGQCASLNYIARNLPGYEAYGAATDDSQFVTHGWDQWVLNTCGDLPSGIGMMAPYSSATGDRMDFPWATGKWVDTVGSFTVLGTHHSYWDVALQMLAESVHAMAFAREYEFKMHHDALMMGNMDDSTMSDVGKMTYLLYHVHNDARTVCVWCAHDRLPLVSKLRTAINQ